MYLNQLCCLRTTAFICTCLEEQNPQVYFPSHPCTVSRKVFEGIKHATYFRNDISCLLTASQLTSHCLSCGLSKWKPALGGTQRVYFSSFVEKLGIALAMNLDFWKANYLFIKNLTAVICLARTMFAVPLEIQSYLWLTGFKFLSCPQTCCIISLCWNHIQVLSSLEL